VCRVIYSLYAWADLAGWKYCWLVFCEIKTLLAGWLIWAVRTMTVRTPRGKHAWSNYPVRLSYSAKSAVIQQCFSLTINQRTIFSAILTQLNKQAATDPSVPNFFPEGRQRSPCSFRWFSEISSHPAVFFSHNKPATNTFSCNNPAKQARSLTRRKPIRQANGDVRDVRRSALCSAARGEWWTRLVFLCTGIRKWYLTTQFAEN
jgi:hypothetical protein